MFLFIYLSAVNTFNKTSYYCTYMVMDPFKVATTQYCTMNLSFICQLGVVFSD